MFRPRLPLLLSISFHHAPFNEFAEWPIEATVPSGVFHIGYHQTVTPGSYWPLGLDQDNTFINQTFSYRVDASGTFAFMEDAGLPEIMMLRCMAIGDFGQEITLSQSSVVRTQLPTTWKEGMTKIAGISQTETLAYDGKSTNQSAKKG